jgi:hypothetical protein
VAASGVLGNKQKAHSATTATSDCVCLNPIQY